MSSLTKQNWIPGTLELSSKVRYGMTSRGVPIFRFVPYDKDISPMAVGCSQRTIFYNVHAIVEPSAPTSEDRKGELPKGNLIKNLGTPSAESEKELLLSAYAYNNCKQQRHFPEYEESTPSTPSHRIFLPGMTFHIDPPGCKDVDDSFTIYYDMERNLWDMSINIADVAEAVGDSTTLDICAQQRATSFYTPEGSAIYPMLPLELSENRISLLPGTIKNTLSLCFSYDVSTKSISEPEWKLTRTETTTSYTYDEANSNFSKSHELQILASCAAALSGRQMNDSHEWVESMMIFYNKEAGKILAKNNTGILRRQRESTSPILASVKDIPEIPEFLFYESAEFCLPTSANCRHHGLDSETYAYASSPIRRYADLVNQRCIKNLIKGETPKEIGEELISQLNRRQKQAKAFSRDLFYMTKLANSQNGSETVDGIIIYSEMKKTKIWVPEWKRMISAKTMASSLFSRGTRVKICWYECRDQARWKFAINTDGSKTLKV
jgi:exoribonuclease R